MRICLDIQAAVAQRAGVGRYTRMLAEHLDRTADGDELVFFYFDFRGRATPIPAARAVRRAVRCVPGRLVQAAWRRLRFPPFEWFAGRADVYHFPNFILPPLGAGRSVVTVHDASFMRFPLMAEPRNLRYLRARIRETLRRADAVITDSRFGAAELAELFKVPADRLFPVYPGVAEDLRRPDEESVREFRARSGLDRPYLLTVGTVEPRKNLPFLVDVFERLADYPGRLVVAGMPGWNDAPIFERFRTSSRAGDIRYMNYVPDADLPALYAGADLFVFPSFYEGFGFPPLEAMACGTPVLSSTGGSLPEVLGPGARLLDGYNADLWAGTVRSLLSDEDERRRLRKAGAERVRAYRWKDTAHNTWEVYRKVAG